jgi:hypothetical protein
MLKPVPFISNYANQGRQEHVIHVAGVAKAGRYSGGRGAVDRVARRHDATVQEVRDIMRRVGQPPPVRCNSRIAGDARVGRR